MTRDKRNRWWKWCAPKDDGIPSGGRWGLYAIISINGGGSISLANALWKVGGRPKVSAKVLSSIFSAQNVFRRRSFTCGSKRRSVMPAFCSKRQALFTSIQQSEGDVKSSTWHASIIKAWMFTSLGSSRIRTSLKANQRLCFSLVAVKSSPRPLFDLERLGRPQTFRNRRRNTRGKYLLSTGFEGSKSSCHVDS
ncbi:hypothetical protein KC345_g271 [Hortaea werneckii]|nr:hypothetical protein KC345_g271 [Hortaea werneckii]